MATVYLSTTEQTIAFHAWPDNMLFQRGPPAVPSVHRDLGATITPPLVHFVVKESSLPTMG